MSRDNPSDKSGELQHQSTVIGVVVDDKDPNESGRFKIRILGEQDDQGKIPDDKLPWYQGLTNNQPQTRSVGKFPASNYSVGSKVVMMNLGQQGYYILGSMSNNENDKQKQDKHPQSSNSSLMHVQNLIAPDGNAWRKLLSEVGSITKLKGTEQALKIINGKLPSLLQAFTGSPLDKINKMAKTPSKYKKRPKAKVNDGEFKSFGRKAYTDTDTKNPTKEVPKISQELVKNAVQMIENLKKTAKDGKNILANMSVGGTSLITAALSSIASNVSAETNRDNEKDAAELLEEELRRLYKLLTGKEPLDQFGKETEHYKKWKAAFLGLGDSTGELIS